MSGQPDRAFFRRDGDWYIGNDAARGPWSADACHGGPVAAVLAGALESACPQKQLCRLTINFQRPVPVAGFRVDTELLRDGRAATTASATLRDADGKICASATSMHLQSVPVGDLPTARISHPSFADAVAGEFPLTVAPHGQPFFVSGIEVAYPRGEDNGPGATTIWMRTLPAVEDEVPSPFQTLCPIADCGNGISRNSNLTEASFINADLTVVAYRLPQSAWIASQAISFWQPTGIGMSQANLFDTEGSVGVALQTLIVRPIA